MSSPADRDRAPDDFSLYAPPWARDGKPGAAPRNEKRARPPGRPTFEAAENPDEGESEGLVIDDVRVPRSLEPGIIPGPPIDTGGRRTAVVRVAIACAAAAGIAYLAVVRLPDMWPADTEQPAASGTPFSSRFEGQKAADRTAAQLVVAPQAARSSGEAATLGLSVRGAAADQAVIVAGLPPGATLSAGYPYGSDGWRVPASDLGEVQVYPPRGFLGVMDIGIELRHADDRITDRRSLRLEWTPPKPVDTVVVKPIVVTKAPEPAAPPPRAAETPLAVEQTPPPVRRAEPPRSAPTSARLIDRDELDTLLRRGEEFLANGDIAAARATLKRAAEAQDARAALALASTYDPNVLERLGVMGVKADVAMARTWYEKAREFGSADAPRRLEMLASRAR